MARTLREKITIGFLSSLLKLFFFTEQFLLKIKHINYPKEQCIFSLWHCHQCLVHGAKDKSRFYVLISASNDGEIVAKAVEILKIKSIRGSAGRRGVEATLQLIDKLQEGNSAAIMVDGPKGPKEKVKSGIIYISKMSGVPIVPVIWASRDKTFLSFNTWDNFRLPVGPCKTIALYGDPIYVPSELTKEEERCWAEKIEKEMQILEADLNENYDKYLKL